MTIASVDNFNPAATLHANNWKAAAIHNHHKKKEVLLKRFAVNLLTCALHVIMITDLSSALTVQSLSKQIQTNNEEDTLGLGIKPPKQIIL